MINPFRNQRPAKFPCNKINKLSGGGGEIRTHGRVAPTTIFKTVAFNRSATPPVFKSHKKEALNSKQEKPTSYYNKNFI